MDTNSSPFTTPSPEQLRRLRFEWQAIAGRDRPLGAVTATADTIAVEGEELSMLRLYAYYRGKHCWLSDDARRFTLVLLHARNYPHFLAQTA